MRGGLRYADDDRLCVVGLPLLHEAGREVLAAVPGLQLAECAEPAEVLALAAGADVLHAYPPLRVPAELLSRLPRLKLVAAAGSGVDHIDVEAAHGLGIVVTHAVGAGALAVAEHAIALMLALARRLVAGDAGVRAGCFGELRDPALYEEISGRTLAIVGCGAIGKELARIASQGFGMEVLAVTRSGQSVASPHVARTLPLHDALPLADIVSVHVPLHVSTRGLVGQREFEVMKPGAWLVDTSRGGVVDARALQAALAAGRLGGAGLDVHDPEPPPPTHPLLHMPNVVLSPHNAGIAGAAYRRLSLAAADDIVRTLAGRLPRGLVGPPALFGASRAARAATAAVVASPASAAPSTTASAARP